MQQMPCGGSTFGSRPWRGQGSRCWRGYTSFYLFRLFFLSLGPAPPLRAVLWFLCCCIDCSPTSEDLSTIVSTFPRFLALSRMSLRFSIVRTSRTSGKALFHFCVSGNK